MESPGPFAEHLNTNYVPSDGEIARIRVHLIPHEAEFARLESLIRDSTAQRDRVKHHIDPYRALVSHARRLPQEIVEKIFLACLPTHRNAAMSPTETPLLLGHICTAWRSIAFALPRLWASLHICTEFVYPDTMQVSNWLARSGTSPLVLSVKCAENAWQNKHVLWALEKVSNRWRTVEIYDIYAQEFIEHLADADAPLLHDIKITFRVDTEPLTVESGILGSSVLMGSNMQYVGVSTRSLGHLIPWEPFVWGHLLHLTLSPTNSDNHNHLPVDTALDLLKGCPRLQSIRFHLNGRFQPSYADVLLLPCLESMIILDESFIIPEFLAYFVNHLIMSNLAHFHLPSIFPVPDADVLPVSLFQDLVERSPGIVHLGICLSHFSRESLLGTLRLFPALTTLSAVDHRFADTNLLSILALNSAATSQALCPALIEFSLETYQMDLWTALRNAVDHRPSLRRLKIEFRRRAPEILPDIQPLISLGLDVIIKYSPVRVHSGSPWTGIEG